MGSIAERLRNKRPVKYFRIGEVAYYSGLSRQTVHNYTVMGLINESQWTAGGHRLYDEKVFDDLVRIEELKTTNTLREIRVMLTQEQVQPQKISSQDNSEGSAQDMIPQGMVSQDASLQDGMVNHT